MKLLHDLVRLTLVIEVELVFEFKIGQGIVVDRQFQFITDVGIHPQLSIHVEIEASITAGPFGDGGVLDILTLVTGQDVDEAGGLDVHLYPYRRSG